MTPRRRRQDVNDLSVITARNDLSHITGSLNGVERSKARKAEHLLKGEQEPPAPQTPAALSPAAPASPAPEGSSSRSKASLALQRERKSGEKEEKKKRREKKKSGGKRREIGEKRKGRKYKEEKVVKIKKES